MRPTALLLNVFLPAAALLVWRFPRTAGPEVLRMMNKPTERRAGQIRNLSLQLCAARLTGPNL
jgi:hypothetical protein